jgi:type I restriction enzyme S subunit
MIADLKPYPQLKRTNIEWLDGLPSHWQELSLKRVARSENGGCYGNEPENGARVLPVATTAQIDRDGSFAVSRMPRRGFTEGEVARYCCKVGDILVVKSSGSAANVISGKAGIVRADTPPFVFSNFLMRFVARASHVDPEFLFLALSCDLTRERVKRMVSTTTYPNLRVGEYCSALLPVPPSPEQAAIVRFLHWTSGRLERAIRAKRKVIALLHEQKQAIIHRAVTRGLDPSVPLKPSGIPWLGDIPQHWEVLPLKRIAWFKGGAGFPVEEQGKEALEVLFLKVSDMTKAGNDRWVESANNTVSRETAKRLGAYVFPANSIIFPKVGGAMLTNKRRLLRRPSCIDNNVMGCVVRRGDLKFVFIMLEQLDLGRLSKPGPVPAISEGEVREIKTTLPPVSEQRQIVRFIEEETKGLIAAISRLEREIELLREYRTRLVADVVTGKLDVREAAVRLPEEAAPDTAEDEANLSIDSEAADEEAIV